MSVLDPGNVLGYGHSYPTPAIPAEPRRTAVRVWAAAVMLFTALGLIALGGCFLGGVMVLVAGPVLVPGAAPVQWTLSTHVLQVMLYVLAFGCFGGAIALMVTGVRRLLSADA